MKGGITRIAALACGAAFACAAVVACGSFSSDESGTQPLTEAGGDVVSSDDAIAPADGGDAAPAPPFCLSHKGALLCEDFDDPGSSAFETTNTTDGGTIQAFEGGAASPPNVLAVTVPSTGENCRFAYLDRTLDKPAPNGFRLEFKLRADALPSQIAMGPSVKMGAAAGQFCDLFYNIGPMSVEMEEEHAPDAATSYEKTGRKLVAGWNQIRLDVEGPVNAHTATLTVNGTTAFDKVMLDQICQGADRIIGAGVGLYCIDVGVTTDVKVAYDDVLLTVR